ncbi:MAG: tryptophan synthase subunit alpha, partial [Lachnospiraceae bacterium]|nr:tryptophan synthase subunit alpha [Lachnospiraceae bacterium]
MKLICYLALGSPSLQHSIEISSKYVEAGCDVIEIDFPASDPYLDSPYIRERMALALQGCNDYHEYMNTIEIIMRNNKSTRFIVLIYEDTVLQIGTEEFIQFCLNNSLHDIICVGNKFPMVRTKLMDSGLKISTYVQFHMPKSELEVAKNANGFIYLQAKSNGLFHETSKTLKDNISYLREVCLIKTPIYCGVGVSSPEDIL